MRSPGDAPKAGTGDSADESQTTRNRLTMYLAAAVSALHIYLLAFSPMSDLRIGAVHFATFGALCALYYPIAPKASGLAWRFTRTLDLVAGVLAITCVVYLFLMEEALYARGVNFIPSDWVFSALCVLLALEFTRRSVGWTIPIIVMLAMGYALGLGQYLGGVLQFPGLSTEVVLYRSFFGPNGLFGSLAGISYEYVFVFILFGAFLARSGASDFIIDLARCATGRLRGGPGFVAVLSSALMGSISGSAAANVVSTGTMTIPMMKRAGFKPEYAAGLETAASTGGQMMPPIMGAGAFVMASYTQIPYVYIIGVALLPAILYLISVAIWVRIGVLKHGVAETTMEIPALTTVLRGGWYHVVPIGVLIAMMVTGYTPDFAALTAIAAIVATSWLFGERLGPKAIIETLAVGARHMVSTAVLLICLGIMVNMLGTTGLGNTFGLMIDQWSNGNVLIAIILIALASLVLGMGLPVTASYIILATLAAPALSDMILHVQLVQTIADGNVPAQAVTMLQALGIPGAESLGQAMSRSEASALLGALPDAMVGMLTEQTLSTAALTTALLSAHMIIFWLSQDSNVTPPVCIAAFAAAAIAKTDPFRTAFTAWKMAKGLYVIPLLFAFTPFLAGDFLVALEIFTWGIFGFYAMSAAFAGYLEAPVGIVLRVVLFAIALVLFWPLGALWKALALAAFIAVFVFVRGRSRPPLAAAAGQPQLGDQGQGR
jgi:TRAP transporter 4TM/12TM fusion protein